MWLSGFERILFPLRGQPFATRDNVKLLLHSTEGSTLDGAIRAYSKYPPHGGYDPKSRQKAQHVPLESASYSLRGDYNDREYVIQWEIVGFAAEARYWPRWMYDNIRVDLVNPIMEALNIPRQYIPTYLPGENGWVLASPYSPARLTQSQYHNFSGVLTHQAAPAPDEHWDAPFRLAELLTGDGEMSAEWTDKFKAVGDPTKEFQAWEYLVFANYYAGQAATVLPRVLETMDKFTAPNMDPANLVQAMADNPDFLSNLAEAITSAQDRKMRDNNPTTGPVT